MKWQFQIVILVSLIGSLLGKVVPVKRDSSPIAPLAPLPAAAAVAADEPVAAEYNHHGHEHHGHATSYQNVVLHAYHPVVVHVGKGHHGHH